MFYVFKYVVCRCILCVVYVCVLCVVCVCVLCVFYVVLVCVCECVCFMCSKMCRCILCGVCVCVCVCMCDVRMLCAAGIGFYLCQQPLHCHQHASRIMKAV